MSTQSQAKRARRNAASGFKNIAPKKRPNRSRPDAATRASKAAAALRRLAEMRARGYKG